MDRGSCRQGNIYSLMPSSPAYAEFPTGMHIAEIWTMVLAETVHHPQRPHIVKTVQINFIRIHGVFVPIFVEYFRLHHEVSVLDILPCVVAVKHHLHMLIDSIKSINDHGIRVNHRFDRFEGRPGHNQFGLLSCQRD